VPETADAIVIGGGALGSSTAFHLATLGVKRVVLCEQKTLASGATGKSAAFVQVMETSEPEARITLASLPYYSDWSNIVGAGSPGFNQTGFLRVSKAAHLEDARRHVQLLKSWGVEVQILDQAGVREVAPYVETDDVDFGIYQPQAGYASSTAVAFGFAERAQQLGASVREQTRVLGIESNGGRVTGVRTEGGVISAPIVIVTTGAWGIDLLRSVGLELPVIAARTQVALFSWPAGADPLRFINFSDHINGCYFAWHGEDARHIIVGLSADKRKPAGDLEQFEDEGDADYAETAYERLIARMPLATYIQRRIGWAGPVSLTPDRAQIIDEHPGMRGLFYLVGCNGRGFKGSPALGCALAEWATLGAPRVVDLTPFRANRFISGTTVQGAMEYAYAGRSEEFDRIVSQSMAGTGTPKTDT
jgi:sarcosine oxidase, subunit beta